MFDIQLARKQAIKEARRLIEWLETQETSFELDSDIQLDSFIRAWKKLPPKPINQVSYLGLGFGKASITLLPDFSFNRENSLKAIKEQCKDLLKTQTAYILATAQHETDNFKTLEEYSSGIQYEYRKDLGNINKGDGPLFKGRGYVQLTGRRNYKLYSDITGFDLVKNPTLLISKPSLSVWILVDGMINGRFTGQKLSQYINKNKTDFIEARRTVNGRDRAEYIATIANKYLNEIS